MDELKASGELDRLELVRSLYFSLQVMQRSLAGWLQWVSNPEIMAKFSLEELKEMNEKIRTQAKTFLEYDVEITEKGSEFLKPRERPKTTRLEI
jgi:hypothetical protein